MDSLVILLPTIAATPIDIIGDEDFLRLLRSLVTPFVQPTPAAWQEAIRQSPPQLATYLLRGLDDASKLKECGDCIRTTSDTETSQAFMPDPWSLVIQSLNVPLALACFAGASKVLLEAIKAWVEDRKRAVEIKCGDAEVKFCASMSPEDFERALAIFEAHFGRSRSLLP
jgi:hypothetical protein